MRRFAGALVVLGLGMAGARARADEKTACIAASEGADRLDDERKLIELRHRLRFCARDVCPKAIRDECGRRLDALSARIPTIVVRATDASGADVVDAKLIVDEAEVAPTIDGTPIELDPGPHTVTLVPAFGVSRSQKVVAAEGDRLRQVSITIVPQPQTGDVPLPAAPPARRALKYEPGHPVQRFIGIGSIVIGVGLTVATFALVANALTLRDDFDREGMGIPDCNSDFARPGASTPPFANLVDGSTRCHTVDSHGNTKAQFANTQFVMATAFGIGALATGIVGTVLLATSFPHAVTRVITLTRIMPVIAPGYAGAGLALAGTF